MKTRRLFFALWPTDEIRHAIVKIFSQLPQALAGRMTPLPNLHLTLYFTGCVSDEVKDCMHQAAGSIKANPFSFNLDSFGMFSTAGILWMGCREAPVELLQLNKSLGEAIDCCDYMQDKTAYVPHVTLLKKCKHPVIQQCVFSLPWSVDAFVMVESCTSEKGVNYRVIEKYPLS